jgi:hypothetical protein
MAHRTSDKAYNSILNNLDVFEHPTDSSKAEVYLSGSKIATINKTDFPSQFSEELDDNLKFKQKLPNEKA